MRFVLDASVALAWCFEDERPPYAMRLLDVIKGTRPVVPSHWFGEVANGLAGGMRRKRIAGHTIDDFFASIQILPIEVRSTANIASLQSFYKSALRHHTSAYDAAYLEIAAEEAIPLATLDTHLRNVMRQRGISLFSPGS